MNTRATIAIAAAAMSLGIIGTAVVMAARPTPEPVTIVRTVEVAAQDTCQGAAEDFMAVSTDLLTLAYYPGAEADAWMTDNLDTVTERHNDALTELIACKG